MHPSQLVGATIGGGYAITGEISGGNMGMVYRATQLSVDRRVAIKVIEYDRAFQARSVDRFLHEARVISKLEHPHIVRLYDFGRDEERELLYLVMEFIDGPTLSDLLRLNRFEQRLIVELGVQICRALVESHVKSVVHRDLKPANILLSRMSEGSLHLKVVDFGVARALETLDKQLTAEGAICGTPRYMPPEQARYGGAIDGRADLYALGLILYEMLCGYPPFDAENAIDLIFKHIRDEPRKLSTFLKRSELDEGLEALTYELLEKRPDARPGSALEVLHRLEAIRARFGGEAIRLLGDRPLHEQLSKWLKPAVPQARAALVFGDTSQLSSEELEMEPLETEWDHTHTVRVELSDLLAPDGPPTHQETTPTSDPFLDLPTRLMPSHSADMFSPTEQDEESVTTLLPISSGDQASGQGFKLLQHDPGPRRAQAPHPTTPPLPFPPQPRPRPPLPRPQAAPRSAATTAPPSAPSRNRTLSQTLRSLLMGFKSFGPGKVAANTAEEMFLSASPEQLAELEEQRRLNAPSTSERLLLPVIFGALCCLVAVVGVMVWHGLGVGSDEVAALPERDEVNQVAVEPSSRSTLIPTKPSRARDDAPDPLAAEEEREEVSQERDDAPDPSVAEEEPAERRSTRRRSAPRRSPRQPPQTAPPKRSDLHWLLDEK